MTKALRSLSMFLVLLGMLSLQSHCSPGRLPTEPTDAAPADGTQGDTTTPEGAQETTTLEPSSEPTTGQEPTPDTAPDTATPDPGAPETAPQDKAREPATPEKAPEPPPTPDTREPAKEAPPEPPPTPDTGRCKPVNPKAAVDAWSHRGPSAGFGGITTQNTGSYKDVFLHSPTKLTRIGARLDWGGTVVFFGLTADPNSNVIDANDTGRELQIALYDPTRIAQGCAYNASCKSGQKPCANSITFLGWNPVQGGDECNNGAPVLSYKRVGDALQLVIQPIQWNPDWNATDCRKSSCPSKGLPVDVIYTMEFRYLSEHVVEVMTQVTSKESFSHPTTGQEFPTLYVSHGKGGPDLPLLLDAAGKTVTISTPGNDGFFFDNFTSPANWVTWQNNTKTYGVGLAMDQGITKFQGWRGAPPQAPYFHNVRAQIAFGLKAGATVRGLSYLALGSFNTIKAEIQKALSKRPPFGSVDPPNQQTITYKAGSPIKLNGWALDNTPLRSVQVEIDGRTVATLSLNQSRPDVCEVYPAYPRCPTVGFSGNVPTTGLDDCPHLLRVVARDTHGNTTVLGERKLTRAP